MVILQEMESLELIHRPLMMRIQKLEKRLYCELEGEGEEVRKDVAVVLSSALALEYLTEKMSL